MDILTKIELQLKFKEVLEKIKQGSIFIHPTDTIYGIGCDATNQEAVKKVRDIKERFESPFSVWVPSVKWIKDNFVLDKEGQKWLKELPGPYTLILKLKNKNVVAKDVAPGTDTVGVRMPEHWFSEFVSALGKPIVTTSANKAGHPFMTSLENLHPEVKTHVEFAIYEGEKKAHPSKIIDLTKGTVKER